ncbi:PQQ-binding-like beta-propeller repeat protein [Prosthecobacter sp.]|uniref:PQQ-like beta-propeller repeat protein n=1 Tax=Prosthecobacter sp. TaxID=1965333 RepID=UPI002ABB91BC|nr:PQQ-binding-like beta-propeller repeat protein [Prosthecobacter sp.]MDZ4402321.1 PQQ-binding-like beta-propeller repeat protein [Prosthecobacter sp.]
MTRTHLTTVLGLALATTAFSAPTDWPAFRGPNRDGVIPALKDVKWSLKEVWKQPTQTGFSSFSVADGKAYTLVVAEVDGNPGETLVCLDANSGKTLWQTSMTLVAKYGNAGKDGDAGTPDNNGGDGPRSTPVIDGGKVYVIDTNLGVHCVNAADGKKVWEHDTMKEHNGKPIPWMNAASPLIDGEILLLAGGGKGEALLGLNKNTGAVVWKGQDDKMTHATPILADIHGVHQAIFFTQTGLVSVDPQKGDVLWRAEFPYKVSTAASPVVFEDIVYCSAGYGVGAGAFKISKSGSGFEAKQIWRRENQCMNHWSTPVLKDGYLYGMFSFKEYGSGPLACVDIRTGEDKWAEKGFGPGQVILAGDKIIATSDKGEIIIAVAKPDKYAELKRKDVLDGKVWSYPILANGKIYARSTKEGVCLDLN